MRVKATTDGFYKRRIREGQEFDFTPVEKPKGHKGEWKGDKPASWMEPVEVPDPEAEAQPEPPEPVETEE